MTGEARSSWSSISLRHGPRACVVCHAYPDRAPILGVSGGGSSLSLSPIDGDRVAPRDVVFARELVAAARMYLAECERLAADDADGADADTAA